VISHSLRCASVSPAARGWGDGDPVPSFATVSAGLCLAQLGFRQWPAGPGDLGRRGATAGRGPAAIGKAGERLAAARLASGVLVVEAAAGPQSFLAHEENLLHAVDMPDAQSPFRFRDVFPDALVGVLERCRTVCPQ
jgi:hypothetical protein